MTAQNPGALVVLARELEIATKLRPADVREAYVDLVELIAALDDELNGADPAEWCDDRESSEDQRERITKARRERLIAALARVQGGAQ